MAKKLRKLMDEIFEDAESEYNAPLNVVVYKEFERRAWKVLIILLEMFYLKYKKEIPAEAYNQLMILIKKHLED